MPLAPGRIIPFGNVKPVQLVVELLSRRAHPGNVVAGILPATLRHPEPGPDQRGSAWDLAPGTEIDRAVSVGQVHQLLFDHRRYLGDDSPVPGAAQKLAGDESGPVDSEEQAGLRSGAEPFEIDPFGQR